MNRINHAAAAFHIVAAQGAYSPDIDYLDNRYLTATTIYYLTKDTEE